MKGYLAVYVFGYFVEDSRCADHNSPPQLRGTRGWSTDEAGWAFGDNPRGRYCSIKSPKTRKVKTFEGAIEAIYQQQQKKRRNERYQLVYRVPAPVIEGIELGTSTGTIEELGNLLGVLGLKLGVVQLPPEGSARVARVERSADSNPSRPASRLDVVAVEALPGYTLRVMFENGEIGLFEMSGLVGRSSGVFTSLFFKFCPPSPQSPGRRNPSRSVVTSPSRDSVPV